jgi:GntR family transcriptional repressor for pyruvate dehydrogenase complex
MEKEKEKEPVLRASWSKDVKAQRNVKVSERIARELANQIIDSDLPSGTLLPTEKEMVEMFGVGRTTLREALRLLETRGVVRIRSGPRGGPVVRRPQAGDLAEALTLILQFEPASLGDVLQAREALEPMIARLAAKRISAEDIATLEDTVVKMMDTLDDHDVFLEQNQRFHSCIAEASGNVVLRVFLDTLKSISDGAVVGVQYSAARHKAVVTAHERIIAALKAGDVEKAEQAMSAHIAEAGTFWQSRYGDLVDRPVKWR